jgi:hypothetical protein
MEGTAQSSDELQHKRAACRNTPHHATYSREADLPQPGLLSCITLRNRSIKLPLQPLPGLLSCGAIPLQASLVLLSRGALLLRSLKLLLQLLLLSCGGFQLLPVKSSRRLQVLDFLGLNGRASKMQ